MVIEDVRPFPTITIRANDTITWINQDDESHTLLGDNIESPTLSPGQRYTASFSQVAKLAARHLAFTCMYWQL